MWNLGPILGAAVAFLMLNEVTRRWALGQIAARDRRIAEQAADLRVANNEVQTWRRGCAAGRAALERSVDIRIDLDERLAAAEKRAADAERAEVAAKREAWTQADRAKVLGDQLRAVADAVGVAAGHPDVGEKILERVAAMKRR